MMKNLLCLLLALFLVFSLAGCTAAPEPETTDAPTEAFEAPQLHTVAPQESAEPEWAYLGCDLLLADADGNEVLGAADFFCFTLSEDGGAHIAFRLTDEGKAALKTAGDGVYSVMMFGDSIGTLNVNAASLEDENGLTLRNDLGMDDLMKLSNKLRGF